MDFRQLLIAVTFCLYWAVTFGTAGAQFVTGDEAESLKARIPIYEIRHHPRLLLYHEGTIPKTYQLEAFNGGITSAHYANHNISADPGEAAKGHGNGGNIRTDFPWKHPGGASRSPTVGRFNFLILPEGKPIVWFTTRLVEPTGYDGAGQITSTRDVTGYAWRFPEGAIVGEVLTQRASDGDSYTFEVRTRERLADRWTMDAFRPFPEAADLSKAIKSAAPTWADDAELSRLVNHLDTDARMVVRRLADNHPNRAFDSTAEVDELPPIPEGLAAGLLKSTEFQSCHGRMWRGNCAAPTTRAAFHVVPTNYDAGFIPVNDQSCKRCHDSSGKSVRHFEFRDWYGFMNPGDQIVSFHPFRRDCIVSDASHAPVVMHNIPGVIERYDPARHTEGYHALAR